MIEQRSEEWFKQRVGKITGSRVGAILGLSPFQKPKDIMRAMVREYHGAESEFKGNSATMYGVANEDAAIFDFELETGHSVVETALHKHCEYDWLAASPDGLIGDSTVLEVKCPYGKRDSKDFKSYTEQGHYYAQMQIEMACTGRKYCYFYQWSNVGSMLENVDYSQTWMDENIPKLKKFHDDYLNEIENPEKHLTTLVKTRDAVKESQRYIEAKSAFDTAKSELAEAKEALIHIANGDKSNINGLLVYPINKSGTVSYSKIVKEHLPNLDLTEYTGKPTKAWGIK